MASARYRRIVVKLSGRAFAGTEPFGLDAHAIQYVAGEVITALDLGGLPLHVFDFDEGGAIAAICRGQNRGTYISPSTKLETTAPPSTGVRD